MHTKGFRDDFRPLKNQITVFGPLLPRETGYGRPGPPVHNPGPAVGRPLHCGTLPCRWVNTVLFFAVAQARNQGITMPAGICSVLRRSPNPPFLPLHLSCLGSCESSPALLFLSSPSPHTLVSVAHFWLSLYQLHCSLTKPLTSL